MQIRPIGSRKQARIGPMRLTLRRASQTSPDLRTSGSSFIDAKQQRQDAANIACIEALAKGDLTARSGGDEPTSRAIDRLAEQLAGSASRDLDRTVLLSIQSCETAITGAKMIRSLRGT